MKRETALEKLLLLMNDGEPRTVRRIYYLTGVSPTAIRKAQRAGYLTKVGEEPRPSAIARHGQAILCISHAEKGPCSNPSTAPAVV